MDPFEPDEKKIMEGYKKQGDSIKKRKRKEGVFALTVIAVISLFVACLSIFTYEAFWPEKVWPKTMHAAPVVQQYIAPQNNLKKQDPIPKEASPERKPF